jgi:hypothetical protein
MTRLLTLVVLVLALTATLAEAKSKRIQVTAGALGDSYDSAFWC